MSIFYRVFCPSALCFHTHSGFEPENFFCRPLGFRPCSVLAFSTPLSRPDHVMRISSIFFNNLSQNTKFNSPAIAAFPAIKSLTILISVTCISMKFLRFAANVLYYQQHRGLPRHFPTALCFLPTAPAWIYGRVALGRRWPQTLSHRSRADVAKDTQFGPARVMTCTLAAIAYSFSQFVAWGAKI